MQKITANFNAFQLLVGSSNGIATSFYNLPPVFQGGGLYCFHGLHMTKADLAASCIFILSDSVCTSWFGCGLLTFPSVLAISVAFGMALLLHSVFFYLPSTQSQGQAAYARIEYGHSHSYTLHCEDRARETRRCF
jgi:hypothetical protein